MLPWQRESSVMPGERNSSERARVHLPAASASSRLLCFHVFGTYGVQSITVIFFPEFKTILARYTVKCGAIIVR